jgi:hypothetical protein
MKKILIILLFSILIFIFYKLVKKERFENQLVFRNNVGSAKCLQDDIDLTDSYFKCQLNSNYSPININVNIIKYQNFAPYNYKSPNFDSDDLKLIGTDDPTKIMKVISYQYSSPVKLFTNLSNTNTTPLLIEKSSLINNNFLYLPDVLVSYLQNLNDLKLLQSFIDVNNINTLSKIANQFNLYLTGYLIPYDKPIQSNFKLQREIEIIMSADLKNIVSVIFNQTITYLDTNNKEVNVKTTKNINTTYTYLLISSYINYKYQNGTTLLANFINPILNNVNIYGQLLIKRNIITQYQLDEIIRKINNIEAENLQYILVYHTVGENNIPDTFGFSLVKRVNNNLIFMNYFDTPLQYYKNLCDNTTNYAYKGRCYDKCPDNYISIGLNCVLKDNISQVNSFFDPTSNYCNQVCTASLKDISAYDPIIQKSCWCKSIGCDKCSEYSISNCNC